MHRNNHRPPPPPLLSLAVPSSFPRLHLPSRCRSVVVLALELPRTHVHQPLATPVVAQQDLIPHVAPRDG
jgi:hypothetical protein